MIFRKINWNSLLTILAQLDPRWAIVAFSSTFLLIAALAVRWQLFVRQQQIVLGYGTTLAVTWAGQFFNSVLPGSTGGDVIKVLAICRLAPDRKAVAASTVLVDRLSALVALTVLAAIALWIYPTPLVVLLSGDANYKGALVILGGLAVGGIIATFIAVRFFRGSRIHKILLTVLIAMRANLALNPAIILAGFLAFGIHLWNFLTIYFYARALGIPISYAQVLLIMPVVLFIVLIPITINGHGLRELLLITYFRNMGIVAAGAHAVTAQETAVALSLVVVANDLLWSLPGGLFYLLRFAVRKGSIKEEDADVTCPNLEQNT